MEVRRYHPKNTTQNTTKPNKTKPQKKKESERNRTKQKQKRHEIWLSRTVTRSANLSTHSQQQQQRRRRRLDWLWLNNSLLLENGNLFWRWEESFCNSEWSFQGKKAMFKKRTSKEGGYAPSDACWITTTPLEDPLKLRFYVWLLRNTFFALLCFSFFLSCSKQQSWTELEVEWEKIELQELEEDFGRIWALLLIPPPNKVIGNRYLLIGSR
jgi:hypothetical protein